MLNRISNPINFNGTGFLKLSGFIYNECAVFKLIGRTLFINDYPVWNLIQFISVSGGNPNAQPPVQGTAYNGIDIRLSVVSEVIMK